MESNELQVVNIRMVKEPSLYGEKKVETSQDAVDILVKEMKDFDREVFCVMNMHADGKVINMNIVSVGALSSTIVSPREVFKSCILSNSAGFIAIHNHPSGNLSPSNEDLETTKRLIEAGKILDIPMLDHIIISGYDGRSISLRAKNMFTPTEIDRTLKQRRQELER